MKNTELRIGNLVNYHGSIREIVSLDKSMEVNAAPIILTEDILLKCGFDMYLPFIGEYRGYLIEHESPSKQIYIRVREATWGISSFNLFNFSECDPDEKQFICSLEYVHQLQNIYFAITGEELNVNLLIEQNA